MLPYEKKLSKVDTLKLAISYISFLNELVTTGRNPAENAAIKRNQAKLRKTVVQYHRDKDGMPLYKYTLSWNFEDNPFQNGNLVFTRTWTPENPNLKENGAKELHGRSDNGKQPSSLADTSSSSGFNSLANSGESTPQSNYIDSTTANNSLTASPSSGGSPINGYSALANPLDNRFVANQEAPPMDNPNAFLLLNNSEITEFNHSSTTTNCSSLTNSISASSVDSTSNHSPNSSSTLANSSLVPVNSTYTPLRNHQSDRQTQQIFTTPSFASSFAYTSHPPPHTLNQNELNPVQSSSNYSNYSHLAHRQSTASLSTQSSFSNQIGSLAHGGALSDQVANSTPSSNQLNHGFVNVYQHELS